MKQFDLIQTEESAAKPKARAKQKSSEQHISDLVGALTDPIIVFPGGWGDTLPDWLKTAVTLERLVMSAKEAKGEESTGTDAEACAYLYTASLTQPMDHDWTEIYLYIAGKCCKQEGKEVPEDIKMETLRDDQIADLNRLKAWLYRQRVQARLEKDRAERRQKREAAEAEREALQQSLFDF